MPKFLSDKDHDVLISLLRDWKSGKLTGKKFETSTQQSAPIEIRLAKTTELIIQNGSGSAQFYKLDDGTYTELENLDPITIRNLTNWRIEEDTFVLLHREPHSGNWLVAAASENEIYPFVLDSDYYSGKSEPTTATLEGYYDSPITLSSNPLGKGYYFEGEAVYCKWEGPIDDKTWIALNDGFVIGLGQAIEDIASEESGDVTLSHNSITVDATAMNTIANEDWVVIFFRPVFGTWHCFKPVETGEGGDIDFDCPITFDESANQWKIDPLFWDDGLEFFPTDGSDSCKLKVKVAGCLSIDESGNVFYEPTGGEGISVDESSCDIDLDIPSLPEETLPNSDDVLATHDGTKHEKVELANLLELDWLRDCEIGSPEGTQVLKYVDPFWSNAYLELDELSDVIISDPQEGDCLRYDGTHWVNTSDCGGSDESECCVYCWNGETWIVISGEDCDGSNLPMFEGRIVGERLEVCLPCCDVPILCVTPTGETICHDGTGEGEAFRVCRTALCLDPLVINFHFSGTATLDTDYEVVSGDGTFSQDETCHDIVVASKEGGSTGTIIFVLDAGEYDISDSCDDGTITIEECGEPALCESPIMHDLFTSGSNGSINAQAPSEDGTNSWVLNDGTCTKDTGNGWISHLGEFETNDPRYDTEVGQFSIRTRFNTSDVAYEGGVGIAYGHQVNIDSTTGEMYIVLVGGNGSPGSLTIVDGYNGWGSMDSTSHSIAQSTTYELETVKNGSTITATLYDEDGTALVGVTTSDATNNPNGTVIGIQGWNDTTYESVDTVPLRTHWVIVCPIE